MEVGLEAAPQEEEAVAATTAVAQPMAAAAAATQDQRASLQTNFQQVAACSSRLFLDERLLAKTEGFSINCLQQGAAAVDNPLRVEEGLMIETVGEVCLNPILRTRV